MLPFASEFGYIGTWLPGLLNLTSFPTHDGRVKCPSDAGHVMPVPAGSGSSIRWDVKQVEN